MLTGVTWFYILMVSLSLQVLFGGHFTYWFGFCNDATREPDIKALIEHSLSGAPSWWDEAVYSTVAFKSETSLQNKCEHAVCA